MKHKTLFRLSIKILGLVLLGFGIPEFITYIAAVYSIYTINGMSTSTINWTQMLMASGPAVQIGIALYFLIGGEWIVNRFIPSNRPYCPDCGYDVSGAASEECPECGSQLPTNVRKMIEA